MEGPKAGLATAPRADSLKPTRSPTTCQGMCHMGEALGHPHPHRKEPAMVAILGDMTCTSKAFSNLPLWRTTVGASAVSMQVEVETSMEETGTVAATAAATAAVATTVAGVTEEPIEAPTEAIAEGEILIDRVVIEVAGTTIEEGETTTEVTEVIEAVASTTGQPTEETAGRATTLGRVGMAVACHSQSPWSSS